MSWRKATPSHISVCFQPLADDKRRLVKVAATADEVDYDWAYQESPLESENGDFLLD